MENKINIAFASDNNFASHLSAAIVSILYNSNKSDNFKFYVFNNDFSQLTKSRILKLKNIKDFEIEFIDLKEEDFNDFPTRIHYKKQIYYRLKIPEYIKEDRILYLDSDTIVKKSLYELYNTDLQGKTIGAVENISAEEYKKTFGFEKYFNSGVLLIDVNKARENNLEKKCIDFIEQNKDKSLFYDQDALNYVFKNDTIFLNINYNFQCDKYYKDFYKIYNRCKKDIVILHFVSGDKPWNFGCDINFIFEYYFYAFKTDWIKEEIKNKIKLLKIIISHYI